MYVSVSIYLSVYLYLDLDLDLPKCLFLLDLSIAHCILSPTPVLRQGWFNSKAAVHPVKIAVERLGFTLWKTIGKP